MDIKIAQIQIRVGDFNFNFENISKNLNEKHDLVIFPNLDLEEIGAGDLVKDQYSLDKNEEFYERIARINYEGAILVGTILVESGKVYNSKNGYYEICGKKVYVNNKFEDDIDCDLYVLSKNSYYAKNSHAKLVENVVAKNDFVYINAVGLNDYNVFAGQSFMKNAKNELVMQAPICEEYCGKTDVFDYEQEEELYKVLTFALREYCEVTGFKKIILGLSGGIDSALVVALAQGAVGKENVKGLMLPSMYSSEGSVEDSIQLAKNLGVETEEICITPLFETFMENVGKNNLQDLAEENLQSRLRGLILMFYSNREGYLLLSTGNKSESAMGYGTLYGDLAGGLNPIADLTKTNVYKLSNWINRNGEIIPQTIIDKAPSAELRPNQKDQDSLPEYAVLDDIIELYCEQNKSIEEISKKYDRKIVEEIVQKMYKMSYKRKQCCLGIRVTERAFCGNINYPILQKIY